MSRIFYCLLLILVPASAYAVDVKPYIVNGSNADISDYPSFASLFYRNGNTYSASAYCGATMINSQYVLTAAHCIYADNNLMLYTVVAPQLEDESNFLSNQQAKAQAFYYPDSYLDSELERWPNDIAIIKLESPLAVSDYSSLLNTSVNNTFATNADYKAVGHGYIEDNTPGGTQLLETSLTYVNTTDCQAVFGSKISSSQLCFDGPVPTGATYKNATCSGDSGGPVYWSTGGQYVQIGITSFGPEPCGDASVNVTSVFTDVYDYQSWISRVITGQETPKAYVETRNGVRVLINNDTGGSESTAPQSGGGGGGSLPLSTLIVLVLVAYSRARLWVS
ncbi:trypsin-like serine protease [Vibrio sp. JPW-9-11-11]|uniref:S1 family peptidase n=1 Tax=Vibrio sp. JPW-9-11-11 TaxID=1416532 RepID=UPI001593E533|nr:trypsin-like serine protease [Vibrio sp. JPW-9-11-11]NVD08455.1 trypsin-like serine protease [Vibrio sp. JPW-9-11-11]